MVNASLNWASFVGIALAIAGAGLYALRSLRPKIARDHDIFFAAIALLCGGILFFQGWRLDPILQFNQFLLAGAAIFFAVESIRLRGVTTEQAKRNGPIIDDERPVSRVYRAELDELAPLEERNVTRRIRGSRDTRPTRDEYEEDVRRRPSSRGSGEDRLGPAPDRPRRRRPRSTDEEPMNSSERYSDDMWEDRSSRSRSSSPRSGNPPSSSSRRRPRPSEESPYSRDREAPSEDPSSEYVDYRPIDTGEESDNWGDY